MSEAGTPPSGPPSTGYLLWHVSLRWRVALDRALAPLGLTNAQYALLATLYSLSRTGRRPSQRELAEASGLEAMYVSRLARGLEQDELLDRAVNPADPRAVQLSLTERGASLVEEAVPKVIELEDLRLAPLGGRMSEESVRLRESLMALLRDADTMGSTPAPAEVEVGQ